jgi:hypothetical protein
MIRYEFKTNSPIPEYCEHVFKYDEYVKYILLWRLVNRCNLTINKKSLEKVINEFEIFLKQKHELNKKGEWIMDHYYKIDIFAELLSEFEYITFGDLFSID